MIQNITEKNTATLDLLPVHFNDTVRPDRNNDAFLSMLKEELGQGTIGPKNNEYNRRETSFDKPEDDISMKKWKPERQEAAAAERNDNKKADKSEKNEPAETSHKAETIKENEKKPSDSEKAEQSSNDKADSAEKKEVINDTDEILEKLLAPQIKKLNVKDAEEKNVKKKIDDTEEISQETLHNVITMLEKKNIDSPEAEKELKNFQDQIKSALKQNDTKNKNELLRLKDFVNSLLHKLKGEQVSPKDLKSSMKDLAVNLEALLKKMQQKGEARQRATRADGNAAGEKQTVSQNSVATLNAVQMKETGPEGGETKGNLQDNSNQFNLQGSRNFQIHKGAPRASATINQSDFSRQLQQIINSSKIIVKDRGNGTFAMNLYPKELGKLNVNLGLEHGIVHGKFLVESSEARDLLLQNLNHIRQELENSGLSVGEFEVNVNDQRETFNEEQEKGHNPFMKGNRGDEPKDNYVKSYTAYSTSEINLVI